MFLRCSWRSDLDDERPIGALSDKEIFSAPFGVFRGAPPDDDDEMTFLDTAICFTPIFLSRSSVTTRLNDSQRQITAQARKPGRSGREGGLLAVCQFWPRGHTRHNLPCFVSDLGFDFGPSSEHKMAIAHKKNIPNTHHFTQQQSVCFTRQQQSKRSEPKAAHRRDCGTS